MNLDKELSTVIAVNQVVIVEVHELQVALCSEPSKTVNGDKSNWSSSILQTLNTEINKGQYKRKRTNLKINISPQELPI